MCSPNSVASVPVRAGYLLTQECLFHLSCSCWSYHPSRTMPPLIFFLYEVNFSVCVSVALGCRLFRENHVYYLSLAAPEACHGAWYITGAQKKSFLNDWTNALLYQAELNKNPAADIWKCRCHWLTCLGEGMNFLWILWLSHLSDTSYAL